MRWALVYDFFRYGVDDYFFRYGKDFIHPFSANFPPHNKWRIYPCLTLRFCSITCSVKFGQIDLNRRMAEPEILVQFSVCPPV